MPRCCIAKVLCLVLASAAPLPTMAATLFVTRADDVPDFACPSEDRCTLRGAVQSASSGDQIRFSPSLGEPVAIGLQAPLVLDRDIELDVQGPGSERLAVRATGMFRVLEISAGSVRMADLTLRDGVDLAADGANGAVAGAHGAAGGPARGGCVLISTPLPVTLERVAVRNCSAISGNGGNGAAGLDNDRGPGGTGGSGGPAGTAVGGGIAVRGDATTVTLLQSSVSDSVAAGGRGGDGGRGGYGSLGGGAGGDGGRGGGTKGGGIFVFEDPFRDPTIDVLSIENASLLENGLIGGNGGAGGAGGRFTGVFGAAGAPGEPGEANTMEGGQVSTFGRMALVHSTLGPALLERGAPGDWDGLSEAGRSVVRGAAVGALRWRVRASTIIGVSSHSLCSGNPPEVWVWSGSSASSSLECLQDDSPLVDVSEFVDNMAATYQFGRAIAVPKRSSRLVDTAGSCGLSVDQSGFPRPRDGNADGVAACDRGAVEVDSPVSIFADGFE